MRLVSRKSGYSAVLITGVLFPTLLLIRRTYFGLDWYFEDVLILQTVQTLGAVFSLSASIFLFIAGVCAEGTADASHFHAQRRYVPWLSCSMATSGIIMAMSSSLPSVDNRFLCMEMTAQLLGGLFSLCVWLPYTWGQAKLVRWLAPILSLTGGTALGIILLTAHIPIPTMLVGENFSAVYVLINRISGLLFFATAVRFIWQFHYFQRSSDLIFAQFMLLSGISDILSERFHLWGPIWWTWHVVQFCAMALVSVYLFALYYRQEKSLQESEARFEVLSNVVFEGVIITQDGLVTDTNQAFLQLSLFSEREVLGKGLSDFFVTQPGWVSNSRPVEGILLDRNGHQIPVEIRSRMGHRPQSRVYTVHDITLLKENEKRLKELALNLERSNRDLENFAHVASHDLREPLRTMTLFLELLQRRYAAEMNSEAKQFLDYARDGSRRMQSLIDGLLNFAKASHLPLKPVPVDLPGLVREVVRDLWSALEEAQAKVTWADLPKLSADPVHLRRVFENLILNGIKYRGERPPEISIRAIDADPDWRIEVRDNGKGISPEYRQKIFELFQRGPEGKQDGTGLGLAACKAIVKRHGGEIGVISEEGAGSTFFFTLPKEPAFSVVGLDIGAQISSPPH
jgi:signal transduction histidine kinase